MPTYHQAAGLCGAAITMIGAGLATAGSIPYQSGRFLSADQQVHQGVFGTSLRLDNISIGTGSFSADANELIVPSTIRIYVDNGGGYKLLSDEELRSGGASVGFALGRDLQKEENTGLQVATSLDLGRLLYSDGSARVRVDVLLTVPIFDNDPTSDDETPEALVISSTTGTYALRAMVAGHIDAPVFASAELLVAEEELAFSDTGVAMLMNRRAAPHHIAMIGGDLSGDLGVRPGLPVIGYRLEIPRGAESVFALLGCGAMEQLALGLDEKVIEMDGLVGSAGDFGGGSSGGAVGSIGQIGGRYQGYVRERFGSNARFRGASSSSGGGFDFSSLFNFGPNINDEAEEPVEKKRKRRRKKKDDPKVDPPGTGGGGGTTTDPPIDPPVDPPGTGTGTGTTGLFARAQLKDRSSNSVEGSVVPAPGTISLIVLAGLAGRRRRRQA